MPKKQEDSNEAHRLAKEIQSLGIEATRRLIRGSNLSADAEEADKWTRDTSDVLGRKLRIDFPENYRHYESGLGSMYELKKEPGSAKGYGR